MYIHRHQRGEIYMRSLAGLHPFRPACAPFAQQRGGEVGDGERHTHALLGGGGWGGEHRVTSVMYHISARHNTQGHRKRRKREEGGGWDDLGDHTDEQAKLLPSPVVHTHTPHTHTTHQVGDHAHISLPLPPGKHPTPLSFTRAGSTHRGRQHTSRRTYLRSLNTKGPSSGPPQEPAASSTKTTEDNLCARERDGG